MDVVSDMLLESDFSITSQHEPYFQSTKAAPKRNLPVSVVSDKA